mmetsp:Transcript_22608/g.47661  ORF Transcript_22608/g.47661 Transcript_22608/m.47661 type:complete len:323 (-) Transcript_22608:392-1360(-)
MEARGLRSVASTSGAMTDTRCCHRRALFRCRGFGLNARATVFTTTSSSSSSPSSSSSSSSNEVLEQILSTIRAAEAMNEDPDFFALLGIENDEELRSLSTQTIKKSYRERARRCHPDIAGEDGHYACVVLNEAYATLMDDELREAYEVERTVSAHTATSGGERDNLRDMSAQDTDIGDALRRVPYTGEPLSKVVPADHWACKVESEEQLSKAVFVDEISCIGCQYCVTCSPATFRNVEPHGRARVFGQWLSTEREVQEAIDMCPVDCIHWVPKEQLAPLEYVMQHVLRERLDVGLMRSGRGQHRLKDVFIKTAQFMKALNKE